MRSLKTAALAATAAVALVVGGVSAASAQRVGAGFRGGGFHGAAGFNGGAFRGAAFRGGGFQGGWRGGGWRGRGFGWGPAVGAGVALGAFAAAPYWGGYGGYYDDCGSVVVGYDPYGNPILGNTCY